MENFFEKTELEIVLDYIAKINSNVKNLYIKDKNHKNYKELDFIKNFIDKNNYDIKVTEKEFHNSNFENVVVNSYLLNVIIESPVVFLNLDLDSTKIKNFVNNLSKNDSEYFFDKSLVNLISEVNDFSYNNEVLKLLESKTLNFFKIDFNCDYNYHINALTTLSNNYVNKIRYFNYIIRTNNIELVEYFISDDKFNKSLTNKHFEIDGYYDFYETVLFTSRFKNKNDDYLQYFYIKYSNKLMEEYIINEKSKNDYNVNISEYLNDLKFVNNFVSSLNKKNKECFLNMCLDNIIYKYDNFDLSKGYELNKFDIYTFLLNLPDNILFFNKDIKYVLLNYYNFSNKSEFGLNVDVELFNLFIDRIYKNEMKIDLKKDNNFKYLINLFSFNADLNYILNKFLLFIAENDKKSTNEEKNVFDILINIFSTYQRLTDFKIYTNKSIEQILKEKADVLNKILKNNMFSTREDVLNEVNYFEYFIQNYGFELLKKNIFFDFGKVQKDSIKAKETDYFDNNEYLVNIYKNVISDIIKSNNILKIGDDKINYLIQEFQFSYLFNILRNKEFLEKNNLLNGLMIELNSVKEIDINNLVSFAKNNLINNNLLNEKNLDLLEKYSNMIEEFNLFFYPNLKNKSSKKIKL